MQNPQTLGYETWLARWLGEIRLICDTCSVILKRDSKSIRRSVFLSWGLGGILLTISYFWINWKYNSSRGLCTGLTYGAFMWLLPSVTAHVYNQHILGFEGFLLSGTAIPVTSEVLAIFFDVITVDMLDKIILWFTLHLTFFPVTCHIMLLLMLSLILLAFIVWTFLLLMEEPLRIILMVK